LFLSTHIKACGLAEKLRPRPSLTLRFGVDFGQEDILKRNIDSYISHHGTSSLPPIYKVCMSLSIPSQFVPGRENIGIWQKFIQDSIGLGTSLLIIGIREVPVEAIIGKLMGGLK
jgi:hypothetical protein